MTLRWRIERHAAVGSTQEIAVERAGAGAPEGTVVVAEAQTAGRGRLGRRWESPPGGLYATLVLRPGAEPARAPEIALVAGLALAEALEPFGHAAMLKWPNDVLVAGRKVAGILSEGIFHGAGAGAVLVGVGVNCAEGPAGAGGLGGRPAPDECLDGFLRRFAARYAAWHLEGLRAHVRAIGARLAYRGHRVGYADGEARGEATVLGVADDGALRLMTAGGEVLLRSGEITPRR